VSVSDGCLWFREIKVMEMAKYLKILILWTLGLKQGGLAGLLHCLKKPL